MQRCLTLAKAGAGYVAPNPMVGAVLVYGDRIIGEGFHARYGEAHAEVNCLSSVSKEDEKLIPESVLYVSLEPCAHFGKTPPCADLIIRKKISRVVIGCRDPFKEVDGRGIDKLQSAGIDVIVGVLEAACIDLNKRFFTFHLQHRPFIVLKWAETADGMMARLPGNSAQDKSRLLISNEYSNRLVHRWRSEEAGILIGTNTALQDNPHLNNRLWAGPSPVRLIIDMHLRLPHSLHIFDGSQRTVIFNSHKNEPGQGVSYFRMNEDLPLIPQLLNALVALNIQSVLVEGGPVLLQQFMDEQCWDELRIVKNNSLMPGTGLRSPVLKKAVLDHSFDLAGDTFQLHKPNRT